MPGPTQWWQIPKPKPPTKPPVTPPVDKSERDTAAYQAALAAAQAKKQQTQNWLQKIGSAISGLGATSPTLTPQYFQPANANRTPLLLRPGYQAPPANSTVMPLATNARQYQFPNFASRGNLADVMLAPELQFLTPKTHTITNDEAVKFANSYLNALDEMIYQSAPYTAPPETAYPADTGGGDGGGYGYPASNYGGGYQRGDYANSSPRMDYSKAPYAWMSKLLNWNVNRG